MLELPYVAGIIDGEGSIGFVTRKSRGTIGLRVRVGMTSLNLIIALVKQFGGTIAEMQHKNTKHKQAYVWTLSANQAAEFLILIYPYLFVKKKQATLAIAFYKFKPTRKDVAALDILKTSMHDLNKRGVA